MEWRITCHSCNTEAIIYVDEEPEICPICGSNVEADLLEEEIDFGDDEE